MSYNVSDDEKRNIVTNFLKSSPPGEFIEVFTDVRKLLNNDGLLNSIAPNSFKEYNTDQYLIVTHDNLRGIVSQHGEVGGNQYLEPSTRRVFNFDHIKQDVTGVSEAPGNLFDNDVEPWRTAFEALAMQYVNDFFQDNGCPAVYGNKQGGKPTLTFLISSSLFNPNNYYNGRWRSTYTITISGGQATIRGNIRVNVHFYEEGNVQLVSNVAKEANVPAGNPDAFAKAAVEAISKIEQDFHLSLDSHYETMSNTTFKALRRALPVFRTLMNWNGLSQYEVGTTFGGKN
jgi:capping protein alpha